MARSDAATPEEYLEELPEDRLETISAVREVILENLPEGYQETMSRGMLSYEIPLERYPDTYNDRPLSYVALTSQKNHCSLYLHGVYMDPERRERLLAGFEASGRQPDMGKSCVRFRRLEDLPLDVIGESVADMPPDELIRTYEEARRR